MKNNIIVLLYKIQVIRRIINSLVLHFQHTEICNINRDLTVSSQNAILIVYKSIAGIDITGSYHALYYHLNQIIKVMIDLGWTVDLCDCLDKGVVERLGKKEYKMILGQGPAFLDFCKRYPNSRKVLFCTENNPIVVEQKYDERVSYFIERHPKLKRYIPKRRVVFFTEEHLRVADEIILMNSIYNEESFKVYFRHPYRINVNAIFNKDFNPSLLNSNINIIKKSFVVFGCTGFIHKGIDILLDAFKNIPDCRLLVFGINRGEKALFNRLKSTNTIDCGFVNVCSPEFISKLVQQSLFVVLPSCSEGMSSGIATCMCHGLIPVITKECGFDDNKDIEVLPDYSVKTLKDTILKLANCNDKELSERRLRIIEYSNEQFSLERFTKSFKNFFNHS